MHWHPVSSLESVTRFLSRLKTSGPSRKIFSGKDLATRYSVFNELFLTAFAGAILNEFEMKRKVRCHNGPVEKNAALIIERRGRRARRIMLRVLAHFS